MSSAEDSTAKVTITLRLRQTPAENVILALAMSSSHIEVSERERNAAARWLEFWNNNTREFRVALIKGRNMAGM
jgi:hypothetical protein